MTNVMHPQLVDELCDRCAEPAYVLARLPLADGNRATLGLCEVHWRANQVGITEIPGVRIDYSTWQAVAHTMPLAELDLFDSVRVA